MLCCCARSPAGTTLEAFVMIVGIRPLSLFMFQWRKSLLHRTGKGEGKRGGMEGVGTEKETGAPCSLQRGGTVRKHTLTGSSACMKLRYSILPFVFVQFQWFLDLIK